MALKIDQPKQSAVGLVADRRLYLTRDGARVVEDGSSEAATLFATPETLISQEEVDRLGLSLADGRIVLPDAELVEDAEPDDEEEGSGEDEKEPKTDRKRSRKPKGKGASG